MSERLYMRPTEVAERWGVSTKKLANDRCAKRGLPYTKIGTAVLYAIADVEAFEVHGRVEAGGTWADCTECGGSFLASRGDRFCSATCERWAGR